MKKLNRASKYIIVICVFLIGVNGALGYVLTRQSSGAMKSLMRSRMLDVSNTAAAMLDGDVLERLEAEDEDSPEYQAALKTLTYFQENIDLEYIYCIRDMGGGRFVFSIDPTVEDPGQFGDPITYTDALYQASLGTPSVDAVPYEDAWGRFYSAYTPVFNSAHQVAGIVAVDFSAAWYEKQIANQVRASIIILAAEMAVAAVLVILITARNRRRVAHLLQELNGLSDGIEELIHESSPFPGSESAPTGRSGSSSLRTDDEIGVVGDRIRALQQRLRDRLARMHTEAYADILTGLGNRMAYEERVRQLERKIAEGTAAFSVVVLDINDLKRINDDHGHEEGDRIISEAAAIMRQAFPVGSCYRIGGDEFAVLLEGTEAQPCLAEADRLLAEVREHTEGEVLLFLSKGCAVFQPGSDGDYRSVFTRADNAMYADKRAYYQSHGDRRKR